jgi:hypothetical protein
MTNLDVVGIETGFGTRIIIYATEEKGFRINEAEN